MEWKGKIAFQYGLNLLHRQYSLVFLELISHERAPLYAAVEGVHRFGVSTAIAVGSGARLRVILLLQLGDADTEWTAGETAVGGEDAENMTSSIAPFHGTLGLGLAAGHFGRASAVLVRELVDGDGAQVAGGRARVRAGHLVLA